ncbi:hypothetical protein Q4493_13535 [Colwellia sp. 1_MG-2023]|uniref:nuclear transport factor 2 family protein n=1 Tax=Colwellia sp. 1_MG-2023 TaxID=3062649 RepID=UPI0026E2F564|nr:hypothetical protein [Colwellia sp. 1_MG-2023]MDO6446797.1 hypothetical protein [Colwellia sp. 1_MG-2023]
MYIKKIILLLFVLQSFTSIANEKTQVLSPINTMFDAMREHDSKKFLKQFTQEAILERATTHDEIKKSDLMKFAEFIEGSKKHLDEKLFNIKVQESGNLASVWAPFAFYVDGKLSHCGVNSFQLIKQNEQWKIRYLIDNVYQGDCQTFIEQHKKSR